MITMSLKRPLTGTALATALLGLSACAGMSQQGKDTAIGAGVGAAGGAVLTGGSASGSITAF